MQNIELFKESLLATNILKKDQNGKLRFHHKTFQDYFGYLFFLNNKKDQPTIVDNMIKNWNYNVLSYLFFNWDYTFREFNESRLKILRYDIYKIFKQYKFF